MIQEARRQETGEQEVEDLPPVIMEEVHTCLLCNGEVSLTFLITFILSSLPYLPDVLPLLVTIPS